MPAAVSVVAGLFEEGPGGLRLLATRCTSCDTLYFPRRPTCRNPACETKAVEDAQLPRDGTIHSFTIQRYQPPAMFRIDDWKPYAIGVVDLGAGVQVMGILEGVAFDELAIGMPVRVTGRTLYRDPEGLDVRTFAFVPGGSEAA
ncbi:Zn-ribbon domain-containing OB-fold protein [Tsuneonella sp. YG55]|uniref:Zn-ribbon domain-containing OB-fold protein n=1 Tax=Tsuneonella litorea TaxID=2976475 RepID=A0A9X2W3J7_9SPHN|nr:Zn-ribbon domain-containing OB-fold protein [Tsuneonella litorea]MCT2559584.1 Zn-ribbon domain-containing OB-fold protein [Tsuneonella litorea]